MKYKSSKSHVNCVTKKIKMTKNHFQKQKKKNYYKNYPKQQDSNLISSNLILKKASKINRRIETNFVHRDQ